MLTKSWFHTGAFVDRHRVTRQLASEYFASDLPQLADTLLPADLTPREARDALRALRGRPLRVETYALDGNPAPYVVVESNYALVREIAEQAAHPPVFAVAPKETLSFHLERRLDDPRISHDVVTAVGPYGDIEQKVSIAYRRRESASTRDEQRHGWTLHTQTSFVHFPDEPDDYRISIPIEVRTSEIVGVDSLTPATLPFDEVVALSSMDAADWVAPESRTAGKRWLVDRRKYRYWSAAGDAPDVRALLRCTLSLAMTQGAIDDTLSARTGDLSSLLGDSGYVVDADGYWAPSDEITYDPLQFYLPVGAVDPFGNPRSLGYELPYLLLPKWAEDAVKNRTTFTNDYRLFAPSAIEDQNGTQTSIEVDALGIVLRTFVSGDGGASGGQLLDIDYGFGNSPAKPTYVHVRTRKDFDTAEWEAGWIYSDGSGRTLQQKKQVEPGVDGVARYLSTGRTVFNNKGLPVKQYEPYFSSISEYDPEEAAVQKRPMVILHYDPLGRVVATEHPDHTRTAVVFDAWRSETWDAIDTLDADSPWVKARTDGKYPREPELEQTAQENALNLAKTPTVEHFDALGRSIATIADAGPFVDPKERYCETSVVLDIEGKAWKVIDPRRIAVATNVFDVAGRILYAHSPDSGDGWTLPDATGGPLCVWRAPSGATEAFALRHDYDAARRPTATWVKPDGATGELVRERMLYSDGPDAAPHQAGRLIAQIDGAGLERFDYEFRGLHSECARYVRSDVSSELDATPLLSWQATDAVPSQFSQDAITTLFTYDAASRERSRETRVGSRVSGVVWRTYDVGGQLRAVSADLPRRNTTTSIIDEITYDEKGRRSMVLHRHGGTTSYQYDEVTFRLLRQTLVRGQATLQDLNYVYDPVGNITAIRDAAQDTIYFKNTIAPPVREYAYDGLYRLRYATGREHASQAQPDQRDVPKWLSIPYVDPNDGKQIAPYEETYEYDPSNNLRKLKHTGLRSWTRDFTVDEKSNLLQKTTTDAFDSTYDYTLLGQWRKLAHLNGLSWNHRGELVGAIRTLVGNTTNLKDATATSAPVYFAYDLDSRRVAKQTATSKRHYVDGFDLYRDESGAELETLHIDDGGGRIALVETRIDTSDQSIRYQHNDHLGSATIELGEDGTPLTYEEYHPYGTTAVQIGDRPKRYRFTGQERDEETGFQYHHHRYYAPWLGRWASPDPKGFVDGTNRLAYARNSPICRFDRSGTDSPSAVNLPHASIGPAQDADESNGANAWMNASKTLRTGAQDSQPAPPYERSYYKVSGDPTWHENYLDRAIGWVALDQMADKWRHGNIEAQRGDELVGSGYKAAGLYHSATAAYLHVSAVQDGLGPVKLLARVVGALLPTPDIFGGSPPTNPAQEGPKALPPPQTRGRVPGPTVDPTTGHPVGKLIADQRGNTMIEPAGGSTQGNSAGTFVETRYPNGSPAQQLHGPHRNFTQAHGHGFDPGSGVNQRGPSLDVQGNQVPSNSPAAHWPVK